MRVLRLELGDGVGSLDLHPFVTVVHGVDAASRSELVAAVRALARGGAPGVGGLVEHQGLLLDLDPRGSTRTGPPVAGDVAIDADHLPADGPEELPARRARHDQLARQADIDAARLEEVRAQLDPVAAAQLVARDPRPGALRSPPGPEARAAVAAALADWSQLAPTVRAEPPWVAELSRRWEDHQQRAESCAHRKVVLDRAVEVASRAVADAVAALAEAEAAAEPVLLSPEEDNRLAELATRPVNRSRLRTAKARSEEEQVEIDTLLAKVGQPTYAAYVMYRLSPTALPAEQAAIDAARAAVAEAEAALAAAHQARDEDPQLTEHRLRHRQLQDAAAEHLGPLLPDDLGRLLRDLGEDHPNPAWHRARRQVVAVAARHGFDCPADLDGAALAAHLQRQLDGADPRAGYASTGPDADRAVERRAARHHRALGRLDELERRAEHSRRLAADLQARIDAVGRPPAPSVGSITAAVDRIVAEVAASGRDGAVPVLLTGTFASLPPGAVGDLLLRLELEVDRIQVIVVTDRPEAAAWARAAGPRRALPATPRVRPRTGDGP